MGNKSITGRELANSFPEWSVARQNTESLPYRLLNSIGLPMDNMARQLARTRANQYVPSVNLDEIDQMYLVQLPVTYEFTRSIEDPLTNQYDFPTVQGLFINDTVSGVFTVSGVQSNTVKELWYETCPNRLSLDTTVSGNHVLFSSLDGSTDFPKTTVSDPHLQRKLTVDVDAQGLSLVDTDNALIRRGEIIIRGTNRTGLEVAERMVFPWSMKQTTMNDWAEIDRIEAYNFPSGVMIDIGSGDFANGPYWDSYNLAYSEYRKKIDTFWDVGVVGSIPTLDKIGYISDDWKHLVVGIDEKETKRSYETLDFAGATVTGIDLAVQPFTTRAWIVDDNKMLYCYDLTETIADRVDDLRLKSAGPNVKLDMEAKHFVRGETIRFTPFYERPQADIIRYRIWYKDPSETKYGLLSGVQKAFSSDFWVKGQIYQRNLEGIISVTAAQRGVYTFVIEVVFANGAEQTDVQLVTVDYKLPLVAMDISGIVSGTVDGIDFDSDQRLWVKSGTNYYRLNFHYDKMLVDYQEKIIYFKENYYQVEID